MTDCQKGQKKCLYPTRCTRKESVHASGLLGGQDPIKIIGLWGATDRVVINQLIIFLLQKISYFIRPRPW
jgi:hypothetical protein